MQITIIGAGISGLVLARCLLQRGIKPLILEKARQPTANHRRNDYGIWLYADRYRPLLRLLGVEEGVFRKRVGVLPSASTSAGPVMRVNRGRFEEWLGEGCEIEWGREVRDVTEGEEGGMVVVSDGQGRRWESEIVVAADGVHCPIRTGVVAPAVELEILPWVVFRGRRSVTKRDGGGLLDGNGGGEGVVEHRGGGGTLFRISIDSLEDEAVGLSYTFSRPARDGEDPLFNPRRSKADAKTVPEELFEEVEAYGDDLPPLFKTVFDVTAMRQDRILNWLMRSLLVDAGQLRASAEKGIVLVGEAAHAEPILCSMGANEAIEDSVALADCLASTKLERLGDFYSTRAADWRKGVHLSEESLRGMHEMKWGSSSL